MTSSAGAVPAYLARVGLAGTDLPPTLDTLRAVHRAHLRSVPYENVGIMLGDPPSVDPDVCLDRIGDVGRAGYCFHHNGALEQVLRALGFRVTRWHGHVWTDPCERHDESLSHLALVVEDLPTEDHPGGRWWADVGLGDGFLDPLPLVVGEHSQDGFDYTVEDVREDGWSFRHDRRGSFGGLEMTGRPIDQPAVLAAHRRLSTPPDGDFTHLVVVQRRSEVGVETVRGCLSSRLDGSGRREVELSSYDVWREALVALGLPTADLDDDRLRGLYDDQWARHLVWVAGR